MSFLKNLKYLFSIDLQKENETQLKKLDNCITDLKRQQDIINKISSTDFNEVNNKLNKYYNLYENLRKDVNKYKERVKKDIDKIKLDSIIESKIEEKWTKYWKNNVDLEMKRLKHEISRCNKRMKNFESTVENINRKFDVYMGKQK